MTICERIKTICNERGLSMYRIEKDCGFGNGSIMKWENSSPKVDNIIKLADYFDVSVDYLLGREKKNIFSIAGTESNIIDIDKNLFLAKDKGMTHIEKIFKELNDKQKMFAITWLIGYAQSQGVEIKH